MRTRSGQAIGMALAVTVVASTVMSPSANGAALGGRWSTANYSYFKNLNGYNGYDTLITNAGLSWGANTRFNVSLGAASSASVSVSVDNYGATDWIGMGEPGPNPFGGTYTYGSVRINAGWLNTRHFNCTVPGAASCQFPADSDPQRRCVVTHEMGHVAGLAHTGTNSNKIMNASHGDRCHARALVSPTANDAADIAAIY